VVLRIDSPGGSYVASDLIRREVQRLRERGLPVVVSMGSVAASGGYFVAMDADTIVAEPGTLTGSIGVFGGKQVVSGLLDKVGVSFGAVAEGEHALMLSPRQSFSPSERERLETFLDRVYDDFVTKVAAARRMTRDQAHEVARGRVWTGADAKERGLVDELGGYERAVELAAERAGLTTARPPRTRVLPRQSPLERLRPPRSSEDRPAAAAAAGPLDAAPLVRALLGRPLLSVDPAAGWGPLAPLAARAGLPTVGPLLMQPVGRIV
jgi:protease-4